MQQVLAYISKWRGMVGLCMQGVEKMRAAGRLAADVLEHAGSLVQVGIVLVAIVNLHAFWY